MLEVVECLGYTAKVCTWLELCNAKIKWILVIFQKRFKRFRMYIEQGTYRNCDGFTFRCELNKVVSILTIQRLQK